MNWVRRGQRDVTHIIGEPDFVARSPDSDAWQADRRSAGSGDGVAEARVGESDGDLYARLAPELIRFATVLVGPSDAEDLLASAVTRAISSARWRDVDNDRAYLYRMLVNEAHKSRRTASRRVQRELRVVRREAVEMERGLVRMSWQRSSVSVFDNAPSSTSPIGPTCRHGRSPKPSTPRCAPWSANSPRHAHD